MMAGKRGLTCVVVFLAAIITANAIAAGASSTSRSSYLEPALSASATGLSGLVAYVGEDGNVHTVNADGTGDTTLTSDASPPDSLALARTVWYGDLRWSDDGGLLYFTRTNFGGINFTRVDAVIARGGTGPLEFVQPPVPVSGKTSMALPVGITRHGRSVYFIDTPQRVGGMYGCTVPRASQHVWTVDIATQTAPTRYETQQGEVLGFLQDFAFSDIMSQIQSTVSADDQYLMIGQVAWQSDGRGGCVGPSQLCRVKMGSNERTCGDAVAQEGAINDPATPRSIGVQQDADGNDRFIAIRYDTATSAALPLKLDARQFDLTLTGSGMAALLTSPVAAFPKTDYCSLPPVIPSEISLYVGDPDNNAMRLVTSNVFPIRPSWSPDGRQLLIARPAGTVPPRYGNDLPCVRPARISLAVMDIRTGMETEIGHSIGRNDLDGIAAPAWQPRRLLPILYVHGCGGGATNWQDAGWTTDPAKIQSLTQSEAKATLLRVFSSDVPAAPAYALDYGKTAGSMQDLASIVGQALKIIRGNTSASAAFVVTHSMGGVVTQLYLGGLATGTAYQRDVTGLYMIAPPTRGSFWVNSATVKSLTDALCPQVPELERGSQILQKLRSAHLPSIDYSVVAGTAIHIPFVGDTDGVVAEEDTDPNGVTFRKMDVDAIHGTIPLLDTTFRWACETSGCKVILEVPAVREGFWQQYLKDLPQ